MRIGVYHLIWAPPLDDAAIAPLARRAAAAGADVLEIATSRDPLPFDPIAARRVIEAEGLTATLVTTLSAERDLASDEPHVRATGLDFVRRFVDTAAALGSPLLAGPFFGAVWDLTPLTPEARARRWAHAVEALAALGAHAQGSGVRIAVEPLSRFHTSFLNTVADACRLVDDVGHPAVGLLLDTFHMNIEEADVGAAVRAAGARIHHVHASENNRGAPGSGHVDWVAVRDALRDARYDGTLTIEAFNTAVPELAAFVRAWRHLAADPDTLAAAGVRFLRRLVAA